MPTKNHPLLRQILAISSSVLPGILSTAMLAFAFGDIARDFQVSYAVFQWRHVLFFGLFSVSLLYLGSNGGHMGERKALLLGQSIFLLGALISALTTRWELFLLGQSLLAVADGMIVTAQMALIRKIVPEERLGWAFGWFEGTLALGGLLGPILGALIIENFGWRSVMWILAACAVAAQIGVITQVKIADSPPQATRPSPIRSSVILLLAIGSMQWFYSSQANNASGWLFCVLSVAFVISEVIGRRRENTSLVPWNMIRSAPALLAVSRIFFVFLVANALTLHLPSALKQLTTIPLSVIGLAFTIAAIVNVILQPLLGRLADRYEQRMIFAGLALMFLAVCGLGFVPQPGYLAILLLALCLTISSIGSSMFSPAQLRYANRVAPIEERGRFMGFYMFVQFSTGAFAGPLFGRAILDPVGKQITSASYTQFIFVCVIVLAVGLLTLVLRRPGAPSVRH